jgi:hypothetical protein
MDSWPVWLIGTSAAFVVALAAHALLSRTWRTLNRVAGFLIVGSLVAPLLLWTLKFHFGLSSMHTLSALAFYAFLCELYIFLFTLAMSSISANLLVRLAAGTLSQEEIDRLYESSKMVDERIRRLVSASLLEEGASGLRPTEGGARLLRILGGLRTFFRHAKRSDLSARVDA